MKRTVVGAALLAMLVCVFAQKPTNHLEECIEDIQGSVEAIKTIKTDLFHMMKFWDLIKQFVHLKELTRDGRDVCTHITALELGDWFNQHATPQQKRCALATYTLLVEDALFRMDLDRKKYLAAIKDLSTLVGQTKTVRSDCQGVVFAA